MTCGLAHRRCQRRYAWALLLAGSLLPGLAPADPPAARDRPDEAVMAGMDMRADAAMDEAGMPAAPVHGDQSPAKALPMSMGPPAPAARGADYSDGYGYGAMPGGMREEDAQPLGMLLLDQLEAVHGREGTGLRWEGEGWYGNDAHRLWLRSEGEYRHGRTEEGQLDLLWDRPASRYWDAQLGMRQELASGSSRRWAAVGIEGLAPYWFTLTATLYASTAGHYAARLRTEYDWRFSQRLILQPELEANGYTRRDPQHSDGGDVSDLQLGLRLRYEIRRQFAPYLGILWVRRFGRRRDPIDPRRESAFDQQVVAGLRLWF